jgi:hypothetical protein
MAKIGYQLLVFAGALPDGSRKTHMRNAARGCAAWVHRSVKPTDSGWYPRRSTVEDAWFPGGPATRTRAAATIRCSLHKGLLYMCKSWDTAYLWENATEPFLNNRHIAEPALVWLEQFARQPVV